MMQYDRKQHSAFSETQLSQLAIRSSVIRQMLIYILCFFIVLIGASSFFIMMMSDVYTEDIQRANLAQLEAELNSVEEYVTQMQTILYSAQNQVAIRRLLEDRSLNSAMTVSLLRDEIRVYFDGLQLNLWAKYIDSLDIVHEDPDLPNIYGLCTYSEEMDRIGIEKFWQMLEPCGSKLRMRLIREDGVALAELFVPVRSQYLYRMIGMVRLVIDIEPMLSQTLGDAYPTAAIARDGTVVWSNSLWNGVSAKRVFVAEWLGTKECPSLPFVVQRRHYTDVFLVHGGALVYAACGLVAVLLLMLLVTIRIYRPFAKQLRELLRGIEQVRAGILAARIRVSGKNELTLLSTTINDMLDNIENLMKRIVAADDAEKRAVYKSLSNQIRPHFLNNALDKVRMHLRVQDRDADSARMLERIMRYISYNLGKQTTTVALDEELKNVSDYIQIYEMAYDSSIQVEMVARGRLRGNLHCYEMPKFTLLPLVENCIHHGFVEREVNRRVTIYLNEVDDMMCIQVEDNGVGMTEERRAALQNSVNSYNASNESDSGHGIGLPLIRERLSLFYGIDIPMTIESYVGVGTMVSLKMPFLKRGEAVNEQDSIGG